MTFKERAEIAKKMLAKQRPVTLEQARAQAIWIKLRSSNKNKEQEVKNLLAMYYPEWTEKQIDDKFKRLLTVYSDK